MIYRENFFNSFFNIFLNFVFKFFQVDFQAIIMPLVGSIDHLTTCIA